MMTNLDFVQRLRALAMEHKTVYLWGTFGAPLTEALIRQKAAQYPGNYSKGRQNALRRRIGEGLWAFDCVGLIKGILWGWTGDRTGPFGGAVYRANSVPDIAADTMTRQTLERSGDFSSILPGEAVSKEGHIGIYLGDGTVAEATLGDNRDGVILSSLSEGGWKEHGKLPWVEYPVKAPEESKPEEKKPIREGDTVYFSGGRHYVSSTGDRGYAAQPGPAKVTYVLKGRKHPYHLIHTDRTSNVYGWVDEDTVSKK